MTRDLRYVILTPYSDTFFHNWSDAVKALYWPGVPPDGTGSGVKYERFGPAGLLYSLSCTHVRAP